MKNLIGVLAIASAIAFTPQAANAKGFGAEVTGGKSQGQWGGEVGAGYGFEVGPVNIRPVAGAFIYKGDNDRYYNQTVTGGQNICRDRTNGQFASKSKCNDAAAFFYAKVEATVSIPGVAEVGVGGRYMDEKVRAYGLVAFPVAPKFKVVAAGGEKYFSAGIRFGF